MGLAFDLAFGLAFDLAFDLALAAAFAGVGHTVQVSRSCRDDSSTGGVVAAAAAIVVDIVPAAAGIEAAAYPSVEVVGTWRAVRMGWSTVQLVASDRYKGLKCVAVQAQAVVRRRAVAVADARNCLLRQIQYLV